MPSKGKTEGRSARSASTKRAPIPRESGHSKEFKKDWERLNKTGRFPMADLKKVMGLLIDNDAPLPPERKDHELMGDWDGYRECHVHGDFLLVYKLEGKNGDKIVSRPLAPMRSCSRESRDRRAYRKENAGALIEKLVGEPDDESSLR